MESRVLGKSSSRLGGGGGLGMPWHEGPEARKLALRQPKSRGKPCGLHMSYSQTVGFKLLASPLIAPNKGLGFRV